MKKFFKKKFNQYGFTLVEIMAVVGIIAIISAVAFPRYNTVQKHYSLYSTAKKLVADMNYARQVAIDQNTNYVAQINTDSYLIGTNSTSFPAGINASGNFTFTFNYLGNPSPSGQFNLYDANSSTDYYAIEVAATGRVTLIEGAPLPQMANADLSDLKLSDTANPQGIIIFKPSFSANVTNYTASVANSVASVAVTPTAADPAATIKVNGILVTSGQASGSINLTLGDNSINVMVTAKDGATNKTYNVTVNRLYPVPTVTGINPTSGPTTGGTTVTITGTGFTGATAVNFGGTAGTGLTVNNDTSIIITSPAGTGTVDVTVTTPGGTSATSTVDQFNYTYPVTGVSLDQHTLTLTTGGPTATLTAIVSPANATDKSVTWSSSNPAMATVDNNGVITPVSAGTATITVKTNDGGFTDSCTVTVKSIDANLSNLRFINANTLMNITLDQIFDPGRYIYSASVANSVNSIAVVPTADDPNATIKVNGTAVVSGSPSGPIALPVGDTTITVLVTAQDGVTTKTYTVTIHRKSNNADLSNLTLSNCTLSPTFASGTTSYTASVDKSVASVSITPTVAESHATVSGTVNGVPVTLTSGRPSTSINLNIGNNTISVMVTAEDGNTKTYTVVVNRSNISSRPEDYVTYTGSVIINNSATITGDILIGNGSGTVTINNNSNFYGNVYVNTNLTVNNNTNFGAPGQPPIQVLVKGSPVFNNNINIYGDLLYEGSLTANNHLYVSGLTQRQPVQIPQANLPALKPDNWYATNGYTIINGQSTPVTLTDNGKYFFKSDYSFNNDSGANNIIIAGKGNLIFNNNFNGSGVIFAPNGNITFNNKCTLTGIVLSNTTIFDNNVTLTYKSYPVLPY